MLNKDYYNCINRSSQELHISDKCNNCIPNVEPNPNKQQLQNVFVVIHFYSSRNDFHRGKIMWNQSHQIGQV